MVRKAYLHWRDSFRGIPRGIWLLALVSLVNRVGGMVIAFISLYFTQKLAFSLSDAGLVMTCFGLGAIGGALLGGRLVDRVGYFKVQFWSLIFNGLILFALCEVRSFWGLCLAVGLLGAIMESFRPANTVALIRHSDEATRTRAFSLMRMSFNLGWTVAPAVGGIIAYRFGWSWLFWIDGLTCIAAALLLWAVFAEKKGSETAETPNPGPAKTPGDFPLRDFQYLVFLLLTLFGALAFMQMLWTVPVFFRESYGWTEERIGWVLALNGVLVMGIEMPLIFKIEGTRPTFFWVRLGMALYVLSFLAFTVPGAWWVGMPAALFFIVAISMGEIFVMPFSSSWVSNRATGGRQGAYTAWYTISYSIANVLGPLVGMQVAHAFGFRALWAGAAGLAAVAWAGFAWLAARERAVAVAALDENPASVL